MLLPGNVYGAASGGFFAARTKNAPWYILVSAAAACNICIVRRSAHPCRAFLLYLLYRKAISCKEKGTANHKICNACAVTEMEGFEPSHRYHRPAAFRVRSLQPLGYISKQQKLLSMKSRNLSSVLSAFSEIVTVHDRNFPAVVSWLQVGNAQ